MPTADPFTFYGTIDTSKPSNNAGGEAFPFCVEEVDVSGFDYWTTLGGFKKGDGGSPTTKQIGDSWINACKLYWSSYSVTGSYQTQDSGGSASGSLTADVDSDLNSGNAIPEDRQCGDGAQVQKITSVSPGMSYLVGNALNESGGGFVRMYNGATDDETNFVGYGIRNSAFWNGAFEHWVEQDTFYEAVAQVNSYYNEETASGYIYDYAYVTLSGIHFVCEAFARDLPESLVDAANLTARADDTSSTGKVSQASLDSLEFYTYT